jgi:hypothetical protein
MFTSCLLACALTLAQPATRAEWQLTPQLATGMELSYSGVFLDETLIPNAQYQRQYRLETNLLVLTSGVKDWQVAVMTALSLQDTRLPNEKKAGPTSVRLDPARIDSHGRAYAANNKLVEIPLHGPATLESGFLAPAPATKVGRNYTWEVAVPGFPPQRWQIVGTEIVTGVTCIKAQGVQQSDDWERGRADKAAWRRRDTLWLHPQLMVAQKVERIIEERAAARDTPTHRYVVRYELDSHISYPGRALEERRDEIAKATKFNDDAQRLIRQPVLNRTLTDSLIQRVSYHLDHPQTQQGTPYRKAILHVKNVLEKAKQGDVPAPPVNEDPTPYSGKGLDVGQRVPDFAVSNLLEEKATPLKMLLGRPVLVFFYNPSTKLGSDVLQFAKSLDDKQPGKIAFLAMAVTPETEIARKQHEDMKLSFPIHDGNGLRLTFGAIETPRFVILDGDGIVRLAETGWGTHSAHQIAAMLERCQK